MIFFQLFYTFLFIGLFTFGGGYSMIALIYNEVVEHHSWITSTEFTDMLAISQMTPGPIGINTATYAGYMAVVNSGYSPAMGVVGAVLASVAVVLLPVLLVVLLSAYLLGHKDQPAISSILKSLRLVVIGLIAAAALMLLNAESFGQAGLNLRFLLSVAIFLGVFLLSVLRKTSPILLILISGVVGLVVYSI